MRLISLVRRTGGYRHCNDSKVLPRKHCPTVEHFGKELQLRALDTTGSNQLAHARTDIKTNLQETGDVRSWLEFKTRVPFQKATEAQKAPQAAVKMLEEIRKTLAQSKKEGKTTQELGTLKQISTQNKSDTNQNLNHNQQLQEPGAPNGAPGGIALVVIRDVLSYHTDAEIA
ncbi:unnamed protein product, partial [Iphiclides podalirius]